MSEILTREESIELVTNLMKKADLNSISIEQNMPTISRDDGKWVVVEPAGVVRFKIDGFYEIKAVSAAKHIESEGVEI